MAQVRVLNGGDTNVQPFCIICGVNFCVLEICWFDGCGCDTYVPCTDCGVDCNPVE